MRYCFNFVPMVETQCMVSLTNPRTHFPSRALAFLSFQRTKTSRPSCKHERKEQGRSLNMPSHSTLRGACCFKICPFPTMQTTLFSWLLGEMPSDFRALLARHKLVQRQLTAISPKRGLFSLLSSPLLSSLYSGRNLREGQMGRGPLLPLGPPQKTGSATHC